jgi:hypothetical protein
MSEISEEQPAAPVSSDETPIAEKVPSTKPKLSEERLKHLAMMREKASAKKKELRELRNKEKMIKQKTLEERIRKVEEFENTTPVKKTEEVETNTDEVEEVKPQKKTKTIKKVKKQVVDSDSDSDSSIEDASAIKEFYKRNVTVGRVSTARLLGMCGNHG